MEETEGKGKRMEKIMNPERFTAIINLLLMGLPLLLFISLFANLFESLRFLSYFTLLFLGGLGISLLFKDFTENTIIYFIVSLFVGIITNYVLFILLKFLEWNSFYSPFILSLGGFALIILNYQKIKKKARGMEVLQDKHFFLVIILIVLFLFLVSDKITYTSEGVSVQDTRHPTYDLSSAQCLKDMFPIKYLSYQGQELRYHFGYEIIAYQLANEFKIDKLKLVYNFLPSFFAIVFFFLLYELSQSLRKAKHKFFFCWAVLFSTLSLPIHTIIEIINLLFNSNLASPESPYFLSAQFVKTGNIPLAVIMTIILFLLIKNKERNYYLETIILTGLAMTKISLFIIMAIAYFSVFFLKLIYTRDGKDFFMKNTIFIPGTIFFFLFTWGSFPSNLWIPLIGPFNAKSVALAENLLIPNAIVSVLLAVLIHVGIGFFYLVPKLKSLFSMGNFREKIKNYDYIIFYLSIILVSYLFGTFITEVTEGNHKPFLFPGCIFLTLLTYKFVFGSAKVKKYVKAFVMILIIINSMFIGFFFLIPTYKMPYSYGDSDNNLLAVLKLRMVKSLPAKTLHLSDDCFYSNELLEALETLSHEREGSFALNVLHLGCENINSSQWEDIALYKTSDQIRTAVSGKQTIIESYKFKGILNEKDYCQRVYDNILFYSIITGQENEIKDLVSIFSHSSLPKFEELSYYPYFSHFSNEGNFFTLNQQFLECITQKIKNTNTQQLNYKFLDEYIVNNNISYLLFERGDTPLEGYQEQLHLSPIYFSEKVKLYKINLQQEVLPPFHNFYKLPFNSAAQ